VTAWQPSLSASTAHTCPACCCWNTSLASWSLPGSHQVNPAGDAFKGLSITVSASVPEQQWSQLWHSQLSGSHIFILTRWHHFSGFNTGRPADFTSYKKKLLIQIVPERAFIFIEMSLHKKTIRDCRHENFCECFTCAH